MSTKFRIDPTTISNILLNKRLLIPVYQRSYTWGKEQVNALIDDVLARENDKSEHYFGVIALTSKTNSLNGKDITTSKVIDGQQRLTTSLILLTYLARNAAEVDADSLALITSSDVLNFTHEMDGSSLKENINNLLSGHYNSLVGNFKENYEVISSRLNGYSKDYIQRLFETFRDKFIVATLTYDIDQNEEMLVFENLNSKGTPLKAFDLIRNHIISMTNKNTPKQNLQEFNMKIWNLTQTLYSDVASGNDKKEDKLERFIELFTVFKKMGSLEQYATYGIYKNFKTIARQNLSIIEFDNYLNELRKFAILYLQLCTGKFIGSNIWLRTLSNKDNHYPFIFALFDRFSNFDKETERWEINDKINAYLKVVTFHVVKLMAVMGTGQSMSKMWIDIMDNVINKGISANTLKDMLKEGKIKSTDETPSDEQFRQALLQAPKQQWIPQALVDILEFIANEADSSNEVIDYREKSIEHILPQHAKIADWPFIENNEDEYKVTVNQIGNLVNFNKDANSKLGNKSYMKKLEIYKDSKSPLVTGTHLGLTSLTSELVFTFETIKRRTGQLANVLLKYSK